MNEGLKIVQRFGAIVAGLTGLLLFVFAAYTGQQATPTLADEPEITYQYPEDGDVLKEPPFVLQMCFKEPVNVNDLDQGGDFSFRLLLPDNRGLGMRIVFQPDGYGVAIYAGLPDGEIPDGEWTWEYRLTDRVDTTDATEGVVKFEVNAAEGKEIVSETPPACLGEGLTPIPTAPDAEATGSVTPTPDVINADDEEDGGTDVDILKLALLTIGAAGIAGVLALIGYVVRKRIGYEPHAPHEGEEPPGHH
ncbi:MAG TPA: hypothetical protein VFP63_02890 [Dehalococcoidia bacterium]|nr:hypothetical protein [Dehalococcoidia bacterium]